MTLISDSGAETVGFEFHKQIFSGVVNIDRYFSEQTVLAPFGPDLTEGDAVNADDFGGKPKR